MRDAHRLIGPAILPEWRPEAEHGRLDEQHQGSTNNGVLVGGGDTKKRISSGHAHDTKKRTALVKSKKSAEPAFHVTHACLGA